MSQSDSPPRKIPLEIKLRIRDVYGREKVYAHTWEAIEQREPGSAGAYAMTLTTALTDNTDTGVRAECEVRVGI